jgi:carbon monoxide dehydrogenase subunit G
MELTNEFEVPVDVEQAWAVLTDLERIAPCLPGAQLTSVEGDAYRGSVTVKVGPITATYEGEATFRERDEGAHKVVLDAAGRDKRQGKATAVITATMQPAGAGTRVVLHTDLTIAGKVAQFGRGVLADVSEKLLGEFVTNLERDVLAGATAGSTDTPTRDAETPDVGEVQPVDLLDVAGSPILKRLLPIVGVFIALLAFRRLLKGTKTLPEMGLPDLGLPDLPGAAGSSEKS